MKDGTGVDAYLAELPEGSRAAMEQLRATIKAVAPEATETISYRMPAFKDRGRILVYYAAFKDHYSVYPASDFVVAALGADLDPHLSGKGTIRFDYGQPFRKALVKKIVKARLAENEVARARRR
jgi:uncharacterized protein YdhG (YjbR/CyaY superfamily)